MDPVQSLLPIAAGRRLLAFGDLNCPFCYALEERIIRRGADAEVEWRLVEHAPQLPLSIGKATTDHQAEVDQELEALCTRAPDVEIRRPPFRPASGPGIRAVLAAARIDTQGADRLRTALFRGLWLEGRNIADARIIEDIARTQRVVLPEESQDDALAAQAQTAQWRAANFNRIPCMVSSSAATLLGLSEERRLDLFLRSGLFGSRTDDACVVRDD
ncbi:MAG: DsbA family protein [Nannocystaceae bacterium]|nr:DsbA family protein [bacterium]